MCHCLGKACPAWGGGGGGGVGHPQILISISTTNPTLNNVGVYLSSPVFYHGQLYVDMSRVTSNANIKIFNGQGPDGYMWNVVYREVLEM
jgi:hypothetical protein